MQVFNVNEKNIKFDVIGIEPLALKIMTEGFRKMFPKYPELSDMKELSLIYLDKVFTVETESAVTENYDVGVEKNLIVLMNKQKLTLRKNEVKYTLSINGNKLIKEEN